MTDRWDTPPGGPPPRDLAAPRDAAASGDPAGPPRGPAPPRAAAAAGSPPPRGPVDHDAPTAKLPAVPRPAPKRAPVKKPGPFPVIAGSLGLFLAIVAWLAFQMRAGADPALGAGEPVVVQAAPAPRQVLVRRVIVTRIVDGQPGTPAAEAPADPAPAAPAPAPAAPLTTRSS